MSLNQTLDEIIEKLRPKIRLSRAYRTAFGTPEGAIVLRDLLNEGGLLEVSHEPGDPHHTAWRDGKRTLALHVIDRLRWSEGEILAFARAHTSEQITAGDSASQGDTA